MAHQDESIKARTSSSSAALGTLSDEAAMVLAILDRQRDTLDWKTSGLDAAGLRTSVGASTITLGGLLKHLAFVEDFWFSRRLAGNDPAYSWVTGAWATDSPRSWTIAPEDSWEDLHAQWSDAVARSRNIVEAALADGGVSMRARQAVPGGASSDLQWILVHMVEEYARHNGHADLIRESIDGRVGDRPAKSKR